MAGALLALLVACGGNQGPKAPDELAELVGPDGLAQGSVFLEVLDQQAAHVISTQFHAAVGAQTVYEAVGTTPQGRPFKAVLLATEGSPLGGFSGQMQLRARLVTAQGQVVLAGKLISPSRPGRAISFIAGTHTTQFTGPTPGNTHELRGLAPIQGRCTEEGVEASYSFNNNGADVRGGLLGVRNPGEALACTPGELVQEVAVSLDTVAIQTHLGILISFQGSLATRPNSGSLNTQSAGAMPATGLAVAQTLPPSSNIISLVPRSRVRELASRSGAELVSFNSTTGALTFNSLQGNLTSLAVGDIIVSTPRLVAPDGFLRRVVSIQNSGGRVVVQTSRAVLNDLVEEADVSVTRNFSDLDAQQGLAWEKGETIYSAAQVAREYQRVGPATTGLDPISKEIDWVVYDQDDNRATTDDQIRITGRYEVEPQVVIKLKCQGFLCSQPDFTGKFVLDETANVVVSARLKKELSESSRLVRIALPPITAGFLVFIPDIVVDVSLEGEVRVGVEFEVTQTIDLETGVRYSSGNGWTPINNFSKTFNNTTPQFDASVEARATLSAALRLMLYGVAGVSAEVGVFVELDAQYPGNPSWVLEGGLEGNLGVDLDLIVFQEELDVPIFETPPWQIARAPNTAPRFVELGPRLLCDDGYAARINNRVELRALTDDKEDGRGQGTIVWSSDRDGALGTTRPTGKHVLSTPLSNGSHTITATLSDSGSPTPVKNTTRTFTVRLSNNNCNFPLGLPLVSLLWDSPLPPFMTSNNLSLSAKTGVGPTPTCLTITWKSDMERNAAGTTSGGMAPDPSNPNNIICRHTFANSYRNHAPQTITASVYYGGLTVTDSIDVGAAYPISIPLLGNIQTTTPSGTRYVYVGESVTFRTTSSGNSPTWTSSVATDNINGRVGTQVSGQFNTVGPRRVLVTTRNSQGQFDSKTYQINVLSALARP